MIMDELHEGEIILYQNGDRFEMGKIKRLTPNGAFVWYSGGDTAAKTPYECIHKIVNSYVIQNTTLGGEDTNPPLTLNELRHMNNADVWIVYSPTFGGERLIMHALVEFDKESSNVWLTNNLGGRSIFDDVIEDGATIYRRKP